MFLVTAFHGRSIPCGFVSYSSKTINQEATSRNYHHFEAFAKVKELIGDHPLVLDREFSYLGVDGKFGVRRVEYCDSAESRTQIH
jgi:hypothetical protein